MSAPFGRWQGRLLGRPSPMDLVVLAAILSLGIATITIGRRAGLVLRPNSAIELSQMLDDLDAPTRLPNVPLVDLTNQSTSLFAEIEKPHAVVNFYAPWCGPCQKELPKLIEELGEKSSVVVVVSQDEDLEHTRRQLANLDLLDHGVFVDASGQLFREARVTALPTSYVVTQYGSVRLRTKGFSSLDLFRMRQIVAPDRSAP